MRPTTFLTFTSLMMFEGLHGGMNNRGRGLRYTMCKVLEGLRKVDRK